MYTHFFPGDYCIFVYKNQLSCGEVKYNTTPISVMTETSSTSSLWSPELSSHLAARLPGTPVRDVSVVKQQPRSATRSAAPANTSEGKPTTMTALAEITDHIKDLELLME